MAHRRRPHGTDKIIAILLPISAFVAAGFEHSIANMFFIPYAMLVRAQPAATAMANLPPGRLVALDWAGLWRNLVPVTLGNIVGGAVLVGLIYWIVYIWDSRSAFWREKEAA